MEVLEGEDKKGGGGEEGCKAAVVVVGTGEDGIGEIFKAEWREG